MLIAPPDALPSALRHATPPSGSQAEPHPRPEARVSRAAFTRALWTGWQIPRKRLGNAVIEGVQARYDGQAPLNFGPVAQLLEASSQRGGQPCRRRPIRLPFRMKGRRVRCLAASNP